MSIRTRIANWIAPAAPVAPAVRSQRLYAIGPGGIQEITTRSTGNPLTDLFYGIEHDDAPFTNSDSGYARAFQASVWAFKCVRLRAATLSSIPVEFVNSASEVVPHPLSAALSRGNTRLLKYTESDMQVFGRAFWRFGMGADGQGWIRRLNPQTVEVISDHTGVLGYVQRLDGQEVGRWGRHEMVHFHDYNPDNDLDGLSPMALALQAVGVTLNIATFAEYFFKHGAIPTGILVSETVMKPSDRERVLDEWHRRFGGVDNAHRTALLDGGRIEYQAITPPLKDLAMVELREEERREICAAFDVPMSIAQAADPALYAAKQDYANFHTFAVLPALDLLVDAINSQILPWYGVSGVSLQPNLDEVEALQEDRSEITQRNAAAVGAGYLSINAALVREKEGPLKTDWLIIGGKLVPKQMLDDGDLDGLRELGIVGVPEPATPAFPFLAVPPGPEPPPQRALPEPRIIDQLPARAQVDIVVRAEDDGEAAEVRGVVLRDTVLQDLARWRRKVIKRGADAPFTPDYLPGAIADWVRADLLAWDGATDRIKWTNAAFDRAEALVKAEDDDLATPEEFEAYWRGIGGLFDDVAEAFLGQWEGLPARLAQALRESGQAGATFDIPAFLTAQERGLIDALAGDDGPLVRVVLAGAARGNDLLRASKAVKQDDAGLTIDWQVIDQYAREWAREFAASEVRGINDTTLAIFREKIAAWIEGGGSLEDLAKYIEGDLVGLDIPDGWSPDKLDWAVSRERARLIAQTETTAAFHEGAVTRWEQAGVPQKRFRTQNDSHICAVCRGLNNKITGLRDKWRGDDGQLHGIPVHPGCRCFGAPAGI